MNILDRLLQQLAGEEPEPQGLPEASPRSPAEPGAPEAPVPDEAEGAQPTVDAVGRPVDPEAPPLASLENEPYAVATFEPAAIVRSPK